jgi:hypothetical protein
MAAPPTRQAIPQNSTPSLTPKETAELLSKFVAALLFSVYVFGFLITSLYTSVYGFTSLNPLRPKVLAAGAWFLFFVSLPAMLAAGVRKEVFAAWDKKDWLRLGRWAVLFYASCASFSLLTFPLFEYQPIGPNLRFTLIVGTPASFVLIVVMVLALAPIKTGRVQKIALSTLIGINVFGCVSSIYWLFHGRFDLSQTTTWFLILATWMLAESRIKKRDLRQWATRFFIVLVSLAGFARYYYPRMKSSWGGGTPISVVLYLSKDSPLAPGKHLQAVLLDESDAGYYIVPAHESKAIFFPRSAVSLVLFADNASDSTLLRTMPP